MVAQDDIVTARIEQTLSQHTDRLNAHAVQIDGLTLVVLGDDEKKIKGLVERTEDNEKRTDELDRWRRDIVIYAKAAVLFSALTGLGTWLPYIEQLLRVIAGSG